MIIANTNGYSGRMQSDLRQSVEVTMYMAGWNKGYGFSITLPTSIDFLMQIVTSHKTNLSKNIQVL